ncbi:hypothetical protein Emag_006108 [Eimeria magna]
MAVKMPHLSLDSLLFSFFFCCNLRTRLLSVAVQVAFEKAIDEAKLIHASSKARLTANLNKTEGSSGTAQRSSQRTSGRAEEASATSSGAASAAGETKELYLDSLCKALQRNGTLPVGPSFDLLLQPLE